MNKQRRDVLRKIVNILEDVREDLTDVHSEEELALDGIPENLQDGKLASRMEEVIDLLDDAEDCLSEAIDKIEEAIEI